MNDYPLPPLPVPQSVSIQVCSVCGEDWAGHVKRAKVQVYVEGTDYPEEYHTIDRPVDLTDCVAMLRLANMGPPGPTGAMGPAGLDAEGANR